MKLGEYIINGVKVSVRKISVEWGCPFIAEGGKTTGRGNTPEEAVKDWKILNAFKKNGGGVHIASGAIKSNTHLSGEGRQMSSKPRSHCP